MTEKKTNDPAASSHSLVKVRVTGVVQGVGFRPFVYRLAQELTLHGYVLNGPAGVEIEAEGTPENLEQFLQRLRDEKPAQSKIEDLTVQFHAPKGYTNFEIKESDSAGKKTVLVLPDLAACPDCVRELFDPQDRRFRYPFTNCTHCGPRFSIIEKLPYDRPHTTMRAFTLCPECKKEYEYPSDRRFHAQPTACPQCGPKLEAWAPLQGAVLEEGDKALRFAEEAIRKGQIVALKGLGGFQLICDARNWDAVRLLRDRKHREAKPFAVMFPSIEEIRKVCQLSGEEEALLLSPASPIVLVKKLEKHENSKVGWPAESVAPGNPQLGVMLPTTPLHHLLMRDLGFPVVATSGNLSEEPICFEEKEAIERLKGLADLFLVHNRPISRPMDDSVSRIIGGKPQILRRARGYAPLPVVLKEPGETVMAFGAYLKNTVALAKDDKVFLSQHLGDLGTLPSMEAFEKSISDLPKLYEADPVTGVVDLHPDYPSTRKGAESGLPLIRVQHHLAHLYACAAENHVAGLAFGAAWDGTGLGEDQTVWGGEFFKIGDKDERVGHLRTFPLVGGDQAAKEPRRCALGMLFEMAGEEIFRWKDLPPVANFEPAELSVLKNLLKNPATPRTSSMGRLFDVVSSLAGLCQRSRFEGDAAMSLEFALSGPGTGERYPFPLLLSGAGFILDWEPMIKEILNDVRAKEPAGVISRRFHNALIESLVDAAKKEGCPQVLLSGGCFQNRYLAEGVLRRLKEEGFTPFWHQQVPPNDGGLALGQAAYARKILKNK
jgi:hydrogenase maturation protein HypF